MTQHIQFLLLGIGSGGVFGALAIALVLTYRSSGVLNFATGAIALNCAYIYAFLRKGEFVVLIPGLPKSVDIGGDPGFAVSALIAVALSALFGLFVYVVVFRPLRKAPPIARAVASIALMIVMVAVAAKQVGTNAVGVKAIFPVDIWTFGGVRLPQDRVYFGISIVVLALVLAALYKFTRFGLVTRATAESEEGAYVSGLSPDRIAAYNWMIGAAVAGAAGILISPIVPLSPTGYSLFIVPALAAAIIGQFSSVVAAVFAGLVIGMLQSEATYLSRTYEWLPSSGLVELVPLIVILVVLVIRAKPLPSRGAVIVAELGNAPYPRRIPLWAGLGTVVTAVVLIVSGNDLRVALITTLILAVIGISQVVVTGYAGQVSLAQLALAGAAAYILGPITESWGVPFPFAPLLAALVATVLGVVVGLPALRIRGLTVAVVTLALAYAIEALWFRNLDFVPSSGVNIPDPKIFGHSIGIGRGENYPRLEFGLFCLAVLVVVGVSVAYLRRSRLGTRMLAVRANERSAAASGVDVVRTKLAAFAIGAFIAGIGGCLLAYQQTNVSFQSFTSLAGVTLFAIVYLAGVTSISGAVLSGVLGAGGVAFLLLENVSGNAGTWYQVIVGIGLMITVLTNPEGIVAPAQRALARVGRKTAPRAGSQVAAPSLAVDHGDVRLGDPLLVLDGVTVRYGGVVAVDGVSFAVPQGAIVGLIGPNGAGKTTLIDAISGSVRNEGTVSLGGNDLGDKSTHRRIHAGLGRTFQAIELYEDLSVRENVVVGLSGRGREDGAATAELDEIFDLLGLAEVCDTPAGELSQGQRQLVSIARALAGKPKLLLLDEPAGGLDTTESHWLGERLLAIRASGVTILLVEHDMSLVLRICDIVEVLNFGRSLASGTPEQIRGDRDVAEAYLGTMYTEEVVG
ncbi:branched-chain amino acid ABC transporter permease/ATP-binding protein [Nocardia bovistercoris]|uniref:ATP-binding cassette domain-containing protein n=1 Tax=Nocardia bovistercoris TaxID=2785916 RepID=A0A931N4V1_9NOCA|nr:branched-chain amino acid ABC transporter permease/ATP-binding protein [Nocardia bovistercoris]MBH0779224.1 ATP-binding cassette domain-containing protein [Nocardia bovistercoris]